MDPRLGTDTPGPGEAVFAIKLNGKPRSLGEKTNQNPSKNSKRNKKTLIKE